MIHVIDQHADHQTEWACLPPTMDGVFVVLQDSWNQDFTVRTIYSWRPADLEA